MRLLLTRAEMQRFHRPKSFRRRWSRPAQSVLALTCGKVRPNSGCTELLSCAQIGATVELSCFVSHTHLCTQVHTLETPAVSAHGHTCPLGQMRWPCAGSAVPTSRSAAPRVRAASLGHVSGDGGLVLRGGTGTPTRRSPKITAGDREEKALPRDQPSL